MARHRLSPVHWSRCTQEPLSQPPGSARNYGAGAHCSRLSKRLAEAADLALLVLSCVANTRRSTGQRMDPQPTLSRSPLSRSRRLEAAGRTIPSHPRERWCRRPHADGRPKQVMRYQLSLKHTARFIAHTDASTGASAFQQAWAPEVRRPLLRGDGRAAGQTHRAPCKWFGRTVRPACETSTPRWMSIFFS